MDTQQLLSLLGRDDVATGTDTEDVLPSSSAAKRMGDSQELLTRLCQGNPAAAALLQLMGMRRGQAAAPRTVDADCATDEAQDEQLQELQARLAASAEETNRLSAELDTALTELKVLRERNDILADALGACALCWGQDHACRACRGLGHPGRAVPQYELFAEYVLPAVQLMRASRQHNSVAAPFAPVSSLAPRAESTP